MTFVVERPAWLLLLVLAIPVAWTALRWFASMSLVRRLSALVLRVLLIAVVAGILAGVSVVRETERLAVVGVIDVSGSIKRFAGQGAESPIEAARAFLRRASEQRGPDDLVGVVVFGGRSLVVALPSRADILDRPLEIDVPEGSDIAGAFQLAGAIIPPDASGRIVLFSDANATTGDPVEAAEAVAGTSGVGDTSRQGTPIDVVPLSYDVAREVIVESVDTPPRAQEESAITVRVTLLSTGESTGTLLLMRDGEPFDIDPGPALGRHLALEPGRHVEMIAVELEPGRLHPFDAIFEPDVLVGPDGEPMLSGDTLTENNRAESFTITPGKGSVLILDPTAGGISATESDALAGALRRSGIDVEIRPPQGAPDAVLGYQDFDLVILNNVPADALGTGVQNAIAAYVRDLGGGLVMLGGSDSFGAGAWKGTPVEPILPVRLDLPESLVTPEAAIVFVIDASGSMSGSVLGSARSQQDIANEATALAIRSLDKKDLVGVIAFDNMHRVVVPLGPNEDPEAAGARVRSIAPGGGTRLGPALAEARSQLNRVEAKIKHVIVLSDGRSQEAEMLPALAQSMSNDAINVSTISVGDMADDDTMRQIAAVGGGQYYQVVNPNVLPRIFLKVVRVVRKPMIREGAFNPVLVPTGSELIADLGRPPPLYGLVLTQAREEPTITYAMLHPAGEPLLAHWPVELGHVGAFTSDASGWARDWLDWPGYQRFWTNVARALARTSAESPHELRIDAGADQLNLRLDAIDERGRPLDLLTVSADVFTPGGDRLATNLTQTGPGVYEATVPTLESGSYVAIVKPRLGQTPLTPLVGGASIAFGREYRALRSNDALLAEIARRTGGRVIDIDDATVNLFDRRDVPPTRARTPIWRSLLIWAIAIMLMDVGTRRVAWDRLVSRQFGADLRRFAAEAVENRGVRAGQTLTILRGRGRAEVGAKALGDDDAATVATAEAAKRRKARQERYAQLREELREQTRDQDKRAGAPIVREKPKSSDEPADGSSGLLAAKKRARERFGQQDEPES